MHTPVCMLVCPCVPTCVCVRVHRPLGLALGRGRTPWAERSPQGGQGGVGWAADGGTSCPLGFQRDHHSHFRVPRKGEQPLGLGSVGGAGRGAGHLLLSRCFHEPTGSGPGRHSLQRAPDASRADPEGERPPNRSGWTTPQTRRHHLKASCNLGSRLCEQAGVCWGQPQGHEDECVRGRPGSPGAGNRGHHRPCSGTAAVGAGALASGARKAGAHIPPATASWNLPLTQGARRPVLTRTRDLNGRDGEGGCTHDPCASI